jgi:hypothetical protein
MSAVPAATVDIRGRGGRIVRIHAVDHRRRLPQYEHLAALAGVPLDAVWEIVHAPSLGRRDRVNELAIRGAVRVSSVREGRTRYTVWLNALQLHCVLHRLHTFQHELEHARRGDCLDGKGYGAQKEQACDARGALEVRAGVRVVQSMSNCVIDEATCVGCAEQPRGACPQGAEVFEAVQRALPW